MKTYLRCFTGIVLLASGAGAQSLGLVPALVDSRFKPGHPFQVELMVSNPGGAPLALRTSVTDFWYNDKNEKVFERPGSTPRSAANWIEVVPNQVTVPPGGSGTVKAIITPPMKASGGYYAAVFFESAPVLTQSGNEERKAVYANIRLGSLILLTADNTDEYSIDVTNACLTPPDEGHTLKVDLDLENKGNTHILPSARVAIMNSGRDLVGKASGEARRFLPSQKDHLSVTWSGNLAPGVYNAILTVVYGTGKIYTQDLPFTVSQPVKAADSSAELRD
jgi:hypothetical protein